MIWSNASTLFYSKTYKALLIALDNGDLNSYGVDFLMPSKKCRLYFTFQTNLGKILTLTASSKEKYLFAALDNKQMVIYENSSGYRSAPVFIASHNFNNPISSLQNSFNKENLMSIFGNKNIVFFNPKKVANRFVLNASSETLNGFILDQTDPVLWTYGNDKKVRLWILKPELFRDNEGKRFMKFWNKDKIFTVLDPEIIGKLIDNTPDSYHESTQNKRKKSTKQGFVEYSSESDEEPNIPRKKASFKKQTKSHLEKFEQPTTKLDTQQNISKNPTNEYKGGFKEDQGPLFNKGITSHFIGIANRVGRYGVSSIHSPIFTEGIVTSQAKLMAKSENNGLGTNGTEQTAFERYGLVKNDKMENLFNSNSENDSEAEREREIERQKQLDAEQERLLAKIQKEKQAKAKQTESDSMEESSEESDDDDDDDDSDIFNRKPGFREDVQPIVNKGAQNKTPKQVKENTPKQTIQKQEEEESDSDSDSDLNGWF